MLSLRTGSLNFKPENWWNWIICHTPAKRICSAQTAPSWCFTSGNVSFVGHYMMVSPGIDATWQRALFFSPLHKSAAEQCVEFWYLMYGRNVGTLSIYFAVSLISYANVTSSVWVWRHVYITWCRWLTGTTWRLFHHRCGARTATKARCGPVRAFRSQRPSFATATRCDSDVTTSQSTLKPSHDVITVDLLQVVFEAITENGYEGDFALDDVTIFNGDCMGEIMSNSPM